MAVVLNMYCTGLGIARNLGREGIPVIGVSHRSDAPGNYSRYVRPLVGPDSRTEPDALARFLEQLAETLGTAAVLFPTRDDDVLFIARYRERLARHYAIPQPSNAVLDIVVNKHRLALAAQAHGVASPRTLKISSLEDLAAQREQIVFPSVVKAVYGHEWHVPAVWEAAGRMKAILVRDFSELEAAYRRLLPHQAEVLVQEWVRGPADQFFVFGGYFDGQSRCLGGITAQKLLQYPPAFGLGCLVRSVENREVRALATRLLASIGFTGIAEVEFKRDSRSGQYHLIEVNPRHWDQHTLATACGVNLSRIAYQDLLQYRPTAPSPSAVPARWVRGSGVVGLLKEALRKGSGSGLRGLATLLAIGRKAVYALWDWRDPYPFWRTVLSVGRNR